MVLCLSNNIKQGSKYCQKLTGQMLCSVSEGGGHFYGPAVSTSQHKVVGRQHCVVLRRERCRFVFESFRPSFCVCVFFFTQSLD